MRHDGLGHRDVIGHRIGRGKRAVYEAQRATHTEGAGGCLCHDEVVHRPPVDPEFLARLCSNLQTKVYARYRHLSEAFLRFDRDRSGKVSKERGTP